MQNQRRQEKSVFILSIALFLGLLVAGGAVASDKSTWTKKSFAVQGTWSIVEEDGSRYFVLSDDFKTKSAPDLKIFLSKHSVAAANGKNATDSSILIGKLPKAKGEVRLEIPAGIDLSQYQTVLLHCEKYRKLWAASELE